MRIWLKERRAELNLTQDEISKQSKISRSTYAMIERGERQPSVQVAKEISRVIDRNWTLFFE